MQHISLFSGIGGFDLAADWMNWTNVVSCEINPFCQKVLEYYWPNAYHHSDIHTLTKEILIRKSNWNEQKSTILTGGFPCQPYSTAGKRLGDKDERHLWPEMLRIIQFVRPNWIVAENVYGIINFNQGLVFHEVQTDLEKEGYQVWPYVLPASAVNAPHRRDRVWFVAYSDQRTKKSPQTGRETQSIKSKNNDKPNCRTAKTKQYNRCSDVFRNATNTKRKRLEGKASKRVQAGQGRGSELQNDKFVRCSGKIRQPGNWSNWPKTKPTICIRNDGLSRRLDNITFPKWRKESIKATGNAIVPQVAYQIFKTIEKFEFVK